MTATTAYQFGKVMTQVGAGKPQWEHLPCRRESEQDDAPEYFIGLDLCRGGWAAVPKSLIEKIVWDK